MKNNNCYDKINFVIGGEILPAKFYTFTKYIFYFSSIYLFDITVHLKQ